MTVKMIIPSKIMERESQRGIKVRLKRRLAKFSNLKLRLLKTPPNFS